MCQTGTTDSWFWGGGSNMMIDFGVWVLQMDGLQAVPFDRHPGGDGTLCAAGLTDQTWRVWFNSVVALNAAQAGRPTASSCAAGSPSPMFDPPSAWTGAAPVGTRLAELWAQYRSSSHGRRTWMRAFQDEVLREASRTLWQDLAAYHGKLATLQIYLVDYDAPVQYVVSPVSVVMSVVHNTLPTISAFRASVLSAAEELVAMGTE